MSDTRVLIVGAGPTGLALALFFAKAGVRPRIIAKTAGPGLESRAMVVQARSLEFYRQIGFADEISPYPIVLSFPQDDHEKLLVQQLEAAGGKVDQFMRETVFPHLMPFLLGFSGTRGAAFRLLSQVHIDYHGSALSEGEAGEVHGGDRLPRVPLEDAMDNFAPLMSFDWQAHVYGKATQALRERVSDAGFDPAYVRLDRSNAAFRAEAGCLVSYPA